MAILTILKEPDPRLRKISCEVPFGTCVKTLLHDMIDTMLEAKGIGLAAPQIGVNKRILVMKISDVIHKIINPKIKWTSMDQNTYQEGCLSVPEHYDNVSRPAFITVHYFDEHWTAHEREFSGLEATCVQHEMDHLDGVLFIDHLSRLKKSLFQKKQQRLLRV